MTKQEEPNNIITEQDDAPLPVSLQGGSLKNAVKLFETCKFHFRTLQNVRDIHCFLETYFEKNENILTGLDALMINAVEHGILGIGYDTKAELLLTGHWLEEIEKRQKAPENAGKTAEIILTEKENGVYILITDPGEGFDWKKYLKIDPIRAGRKHGRGIALANALSFDKLSYNQDGNQAVAFISRKEKLKWS